MRFANGWIWITVILFLAALGYLAYEFLNYFQVNDIKSLFKMHG